MKYTDRQLYDTTHGSPFDRGSADSYYGRSRDPHKGGVGSRFGARSELLTTAEITDYYAGYEWNEQCGYTKDYA